MQKKFIGVLILLGGMCLCACNQTGEERGKGVTVFSPSATSAVAEEVTLTPAPTPTKEPTPTPLPPDVTAPELTLLGEATMKVVARNEFVDPGVEATDDRDGDLTASVQIAGEVDVNWCGTYTLSYSVSDTAGNVTTAERVVEVAQPETVVPTST